MGDKPNQRQTLFRSGLQGRGIEKRQDIVAPLSASQKNGTAEIVWGLIRFVQ